MAEINRKKLIVNYIPQMTDEHFTSLFSEVGPLISSKIVRDKKTGYNYGFGFVEYPDEEIAAAAIEMLNGHPVENKKLRVAYSREGENIKGANLYVCNLPDFCDEERLREVFSEYGTVVHCRILTDQHTGMSKGVGFVLFETKDQARWALSKTNGKIPEGFNVALKVSFADENRPQTNKNQHPINFPDPAWAIPTVGAGMRPPIIPPIPAGNGVPPFMAGGANPMSFMQPKPPGSAANPYEGFASAFANLLSASYAMGQMNGGGGAAGGGGGAGANFLGFPKPADLSYMFNQPGMAEHMNAMKSALSLSAARQNPIAPPVKRQQTVRSQDGYILFVYNIGPNTREQDLRMLFGPFGAVTKVNVMMDHAKNVAKGYAFVTMPNYDEAANAIQYLNGYNFTGKPLQVSFKTNKD